jgi:hypothetical protein
LFAPDKGSKKQEEIKTVTKMLKKDLVNKYEALSSEESGYQLQNRF